MSPSSNGKSVALVAVVVLFIACGGQSDPSRTNPPISTGGASDTALTHASAGSVSLHASTAANGGVRASGTSSATNWSAARGGAFTVETDGGSGGTTTVAQAGSSKSSTASTSHSGGQGGAKTNVTAATLAGDAAFAGADRGVGGVPAIGGSTARSPVMPGAGAYAGGTNTAGAATGTAEDGTNGIGGTVSGTTRLSISNALTGIWLIGWSGGLEHYSWIRFSTYDATTGGQADVLDVTQSGAAWTSYLGCEGRGRWYLTARPETIEVRLPAACPNARIVVSFTSINPNSEPGMFNRATLQAAVAVDELSTSGGNPIRAYKYHDTQCDTAMTSCESPV